MIVWTYDAAGNRLSDGTTTYVSGAGSERLRARDGPWFLGDALGSVRTTLDDAGAVVATASYDPWGTPQGELVGPFGFTGELHHGDQVYLRARWYTPGWGTFPSRDPFAGFPEMPYSLHAYQYAYAAPTVWTDPSGEVIPRCPIGYHPMMRADGSFGGCARTGQVPPWVSDVSLGLPIPGTAGHLGGRTLGHLGREGLETCINLIGGTLVWMLTQTHVDTQTQNRQSCDRIKIPASCAQDFTQYPDISFQCFRCATRIARKIQGANPTSTVLIVELMT